jgi:hypothetical protein
MDSNDHIEVLRRLVGWRNETQQILFDLYRLVAERQSAVESNSETNAAFQLCVGAAFSLWRAIVLFEHPLKQEPSLEASKRLLERVVSTNAILFGDELAAREWMSGFYVGNIQFRLSYLEQEYKQFRITDLEHFVAKWKAKKEERIDNDEFFTEVIACLKALIQVLQRLTKRS